MTEPHVGYSGEPITPMTWPRQQIVEGGCYQPGWYPHPGQTHGRNFGPMSTPRTTPGWYPDPSGQPGQRYHDGQRWTKHFTPTPPPMFAPAPPPSVAVAVSAGGGTNHALHLILTLLSCGLWLPIWILVAIFNTGGSTAVAVGGAGASTGPRFNRTPLIIGGVILGLVVLGQAAQHPLLFIPLFLLAGAGGVFFWKQKTAKDAKELELREQYRRDVVANRADYEDELWHEGDPRGTHGRYPPSPEVF